MAIMHPLDKKTPLTGMLGNEKRSRELENLSFAEKAQKFEKRAEQIVFAEQLVNLVRGFITGCGGLRGVTEAKCTQFVRDHKAVVVGALDATVVDNDADLPAAVYALCRKVGR
jgi:hypothetical protein